jgi:xylulokinase
MGEAGWRCSGVTGVPLVLAIDLGLTNCKAVVFNADGEMVASASVPHPVYSPRPGNAEQDPERWWQTTCQATRALWDRRPELPAWVEAVSVTGQMHALVCLGHSGQALGNALVLGDQRAVGEANHIAAELGMQRIHTTTGARMDASVPAAKILWLRKNAPEICRAAQLYLGCKDFLRRKMCGDRSTDAIDACATSLYDIRSCTWWPDMLQVVGIEKNKLPDVADPTGLAGSLLREPAENLGLRAGIPVVVGSGDDIGVLGSGIVGVGRTMESIGTTAAIMTCSEQPVFDPDMALELYPHAEPGLWVLGGSITAGGAAVAWAAECLQYPEVNAAFSSLDEAMLESEPLIFVPHLSGERCPSWEPGVRGAWIGLSKNHSRSHMMRAVFEGIAFALKVIMGRLEELGVRQEVIRVRQRQMEDERWLLAKTAIYERPLEIMNSPEPSALGAMMLAAVGIGLSRNLREAASRLSIVKREVAADEDNRGPYRRRYDFYRRAQSALLQLWRIAQ